MCLFVLQCFDLKSTYRRPLLLLPLGLERCEAAAPSEKHGRHKPTAKAEVVDTCAGHASSEPLDSPQEREREKKNPRLAEKQGEAPLDATGTALRSPISGEGPRNSSAMRNKTCNRPGKEKEVNIVSLWRKRKKERQKGILVDATSEKARQVLLGRPLTMRRRCRARKERAQHADELYVSIAQQSPVGID